jgi:hypothetical protein
MQILVIFFKPEDKNEAPPSEMHIIRAGQDVDFLFHYTLDTNKKTMDDVLHASVVDSGDKVIPEFYLPCLVYDRATDSVKWDSAKMIELNFNYWMPQRRELLRDLDIQFMRALEKNNEKERKIIVTNKEFLRDLPNFVLTKWAETLEVVKSNGEWTGISQNDSRFSQRNGKIYYKGTPVGLVDSFDAFTTSQQRFYVELFNQRYGRQDALRFTPFHNILIVDILSGGSGYTVSPTIEFQCEYAGAMPPKYQCVIENGSLTEVIVITPGCGYIEEPKLIVSKPTLPNGKQAVVSAKVYNRVIQEYPSFTQEELEDRLPKEF